MTFAVDGGVRGHGISSPSTIEVVEAIAVEAITVEAIATDLWTPKMPVAAPSVPWRRPTCTSVNSCGATLRGFCADCRRRD